MMAWGVFIVSSVATLTYAAFTTGVLGKAAQLKIATCVTFAHACTLEIAIRSDSGSVEITRRRRVGRAAPRNTWTLVDLESRADAATSAQSASPEASGLASTVYPVYTPGAV